MSTLISNNMIKIKCNTHPFSNIKYILIKNNRKND